MMNDAGLRVFPTRFDGLFVAESVLHRDERGEFARVFCASVFATIRPELRFVQVNHSVTSARGTVRGMHYQAAPHAEAKLVRCIRGAVFDVAVDLRPGSHTYGEWFGVNLTESNGFALFIPEGFAHGFQALSDDAGLLYQHTAPYNPEAERGLHHADPDIGIEWPLPVGLLSARDRALPSLASVTSTARALGTAA